jgi:hypothetical protein
MASSSVVGTHGFPSAASGVVIPVAPNVILEAVVACFCPWQCSAVRDYDSVGGLPFDWCVVGMASGARAPNLC